MSEAEYHHTPLEAAGKSTDAGEALLRRTPHTARALQSAILTSSSFSIIATDEKGIIQVFNLGAERMLGYAAHEVVNKVCPSDLHDPDEVIARARELSIELASPIAPGFEALAFKASRGIEDSYALTYIRKDGSRFPALVSVTALRDDAGEIIGYLLIGTDNSVRKRIESGLNEAMAAADKANRAKSDFLSSMSHELRTPLNAILGFAQLMESSTPPPTPTQKRDLDKILRAGWYLLELINEILGLALIESGKITLSTEPVSLVDVMVECRAMIEPQAQKRGIAMTFPLLERPTLVKADRTRLKQVLINLLFNAIKYNSPKGTVAVECIPGTSGSIRISVRDTGPGLDPEQLAQLFQPFNRLGKESGAEEGTGIGLVVTKRLVELMGGAIGADSALGMGSVFWIELSLTSAPQLADREAAAVARMRPPLPEGRSPRTLLYVEDNPANLELVEQLIARRSDLRLMSAANGALGIDFARTFQPEVILMDINLPGLSGIEAMQILRADPSTAHIPIVALSANDPAGEHRGSPAVSGFRLQPRQCRRLETKVPGQRGADVQRVVPIHRLPRHRRRTRAEVIARPGSVPRHGIRPQPKPEPSPRRPARGGIRAPRLAPRAGRAAARRNPLRTRRTDAARLFPD